LHGGLAGDWLLLFQHYKGWYNTISNSMKMLLPPKERFAGTIYNAIDVASYPFNSGKRDGYLLFLSRMSPEKGPHLAIEVARRLGMPLVLAGNVNDVDQEYFCTQVQPHLDGSLVRYVGEADYKGKRELLSRAYCLLAPITWPEPFGLFMVEAMACGTPVLAFNRGSAPEVVQHGVTGFVVDTLEEMVEAAHQVDRLDPRACRQYTECHFNVHRMVDDYEVAYRGIMAIEGYLPTDDAARLGRAVARLGYGPPEEGVPMIASAALQS
jgi:glycosyltransferase involved in cell wall biosynthesis